jgi:hypothetical protein
MFVQVLQDLLVDPTIHYMSDPRLQKLCTTLHELRTAPQLLPSGVAIFQAHHHIDLLKG